MPTTKQKKHDRSQSTIKAMMDKMRTPAEKRQRRAQVQSLRRFLKNHDRWTKHPRYLGVTFPGITDGDRKAAEFIQIVRDLVAEHR